MYFYDMNRLTIEQRAAILGMLVEGNSLRACARMADVSLITVTKLLVEVGTACEQFHNERVNNLRVRRLQCDEISWVMLTRVCSGVRLASFWNWLNFLRLVRI